MKWLFLVGSAAAFGALASTVGAAPDGRWYISSLEAGLFGDNGWITNGYAYVDRVDLAANGSFSGETVKDSEGFQETFSGSWSLTQGRIQLTESGERVEVMVNQSHDVVLLSEDGADEWGSWVSLAVGVREPASVSMQDLADEWTLIGLGLGVQDSGSSYNDSAYIVGRVTLNANGSSSYEVIDSTYAEEIGDSFNFNWTVSGKEVVSIPGLDLYVGAEKDVMVGAYEEPDGPGSTWFETEILLREPDAVAANELVGKWGYTLINVFFENGNDYVGQETGVLTLNADGSANASIRSATRDLEPGERNVLLSWSVSGNRLIVSDGGEPTVLRLNQSKDVAAGIIGSETESEFTILVRNDGLVASRAAALFPGITEHSGNWGFSDWFGWMQFDGEPYLLHLEHGWVFTTGMQGSGLWFYSQDIGWAFTTTGLYPLLYVPSRGGYMAYLRGTSVNGGGRWFYHYTANEWVLLPGQQ